MERSIEVVGYSLDLRVNFFMGRLDGKASALRDESLGRYSQFEVPNFLIQDQSSNFLNTILAIGSPCEARVALVDLSFPVCIGHSIHLCSLCLVLVHVCQPILAVLFAQPQFRLR